MPSPFPGVDPFLEHPALWPDVHNRLIAAVADALAPVVRPSYYVAIEERIQWEEPDLAIVGRADVALVGVGHSQARASASAAPAPQAVMVELAMPERIRQTYLEIRAVSGEVVTVIEILSPTNKRPGAGRSAYVEKRLAILSSLTSLVEVDLVQSGHPMAGVERRTGYAILVSHSWKRPQASLHLFGTRDTIPSIGVPLRPGEEEPTLDLQTVLAALYDRAGYDLRIDYRREPEPQLDAADAAWARQVLARVPPS